MPLRSARAFQARLLGWEIDDEPDWIGEHGNGGALQAVEPDRDIGLALEYRHHHDLLQLTKRGLLVGPVQERRWEVHVVDDEVDPGVAGDGDGLAAVRADEGLGILSDELVVRLPAAVLDHQAVVSRVRTNANVGDGGPG